jgi:ATP-binding cassette subfamily B protein
MPSSFFAFAWKQIKPFQWVFLGLFLLASLTGLYGTLISYLIKVVIDSMVGLGANASPEAIIKASTWPAIFFVLNYEIHDLLWRGVEYLNLKTAPKIKTRVIEQLYNHIHQHPPRFFQENFAGTISNNLTVLVDNMEKVLHNSGLYLFTTLIQLSVALFTMYSVHAIFALGLLIWAGGFLGIRFLLAKRARTLSYNYAHSQSMVSGKLVESFQFRDDAKTHYLVGYLAVMQEKFIKKEWFLLIISICQGLSISALISFMLFFLIKLKSQNLVSIGDFALILGLVLTITKNMWTLTKHIDIINDAIGKCSQSLKMLLVPLEVKPQVRDLKDRAVALDYQ